MSNIRKKNTNIINFKEYDIPSKVFIGTDGPTARMGDGPIFMQQEEGILNIQNGNSIIALTSSGVGVGETCGGYQFNVEGLSRFTQAVRMGSHVLTPLGELEAYINENSHLPGVPSADEVEKEGADLGEMNRLLMEKVEELTLYIIDLQKQIDALKSKTVK